MTTATTPGYTRIAYRCGHSFEMATGQPATRWAQREAKREAKCQDCREMGTCARCGTQAPVRAGHLNDGQPSGLMCDACWKAVRAF